MNDELLIEEDIEQFLEEEQQEALKGNNANIDRKYIPELEQKFKSIIEAQNYFNFYAYMAGFSIVNVHSARTTSKKRNREVIRVTFKCYKYVKADCNTKPETVDETATGERKTNEVIGTECKCVMVISERNLEWVITRLDLDHNHELSPPDEVRFLRSHKYLSTEERVLIRTLKECHIPTRNMIVILSVLRGRLTSLPYTKKDISNVRTEINRETSSNDMMQCLTYLKKKQEEDPNFFYEFDLDENRKVRNFFWTDGRSRDWYHKFGDCISFDTTFLTNRYNLPFAPFVGVSGHGNTILFGCAFLHDETTETFEWLFTTFLKCMNGKQPNTIITDQDGAMRAAIKNIFREAKHRNCFFHIISKALKRSGSLFKKRQGLYAIYSDIIHNCLTEEEFEVLWQDMIQEFNLQEINFLAHMWHIRKRFIPVYFKTDFCPFIQSIALSEGTNSRFKKNVGPQYRIRSFLTEYERVMDTIQNLEQHDDHESRTKRPTSFWSNYSIEYQAVKLYNNKIFKRFQAQLRKTLELQVEEIEKFKCYAVFEAENVISKQIRKRKYLVMMDLDTEEYTCICAMFQKDGILCSHILKIMLHLSIKEIPEKYIMHRWRKNHKSTEIIKGKEIIPVSESSVLRFNILSRKFAEIASKGAKTVEA